MKTGTKSFKDISALVRGNIVNMKPYASARDEFKGDAEVFLDANENPFPSDYNRYPDPQQWKVKEKLAVIKHIAPSQIFLGNGSDEAIDLLIRAFCEPGIDTITIAEPTYGMYAVCAAVNAVQVETILLSGEFDLLPDSFSASESKSKILFLCSPNNPSGNLLSRDGILKILKQFGGLVVIDEAYIDFSDSPGFTHMLADFPNLVVLQTLSKAWGLAGLRLGMCFASQEIIQILNKIKYPYNVNTATQHIVLEALEHEARKNAWVKDLVAERNKMAVALSNLPITEQVFPSDANFLLVRIKSASATYRYLMTEGIVVRDRSNVVQCNDCLRITIGTADENNILLNALHNLALGIP